MAALRADVAPVNVDYYTDAATETSVEVRTQHDRRASERIVVAFGDVTVSERVVGYRRIKRFTHEMLGVHMLDYPPLTIDTSAYWFAVQPAAQALLERAGLWFDSANDYGPNWQEQRTHVRARDQHRCVQCGAPEPPGREHDVHHRIPFRAFGYVRGLNDAFLAANRLDNLMLVCRTCHQRLETAGRLRTGLDGLAYTLSNLAPLHLMCDPTDLGVHVERGEVQAPATVYIYERVPAGLGFSALLFEMHDELLAAAQVLIAACPCQQGCPACVGPVQEDQPMQLETKRLTAGLLGVLLSTTGDLA